MDIIVQRSLDQGRISINRLISVYNFTGEVGWKEYVYTQCRLNSPAQRLLISAVNYLCKEEAAEIDMVVVFPGRTLSRGEY